MTLSNIVEDIRATIENGESSPSAKDLDIFLEEVRNAVIGLFDRRDSRDTEENNILRFSSLGKKNRQLWYKAHTQSNASYNPLPYDTALKFTYGNILESLLLLLVKTAGYDVSDSQKEYELDGVRGHIDCKINGYVVDCKSASGYSFSKFKKGDLMDDPFGYMHQLSAYIQADGMKNEGGFLVINKESGEICYMPVHDLELPNAKERIKEAKDIIANDTPPERCYTPSKARDGREYLKTGCVYCNFKDKCWEDSNQGIGLVYETGADGKTRYYTNTMGNPF
jgi:hypothetical protein